MYHLLNTIGLHAHGGKGECKTHFLCVLKLSSLSAKKLHSSKNLSLYTNDVRKKNKEIIGKYTQGGVFISY